jgi:hypothetical protein
MKRLPNSVPIGRTNHARRVETTVQKKEQKQANKPKILMIYGGCTGPRLWGPGDLRVGKDSYTSLQAGIAWKIYTRTGILYPKEQLLFVCDNDYDRRLLYHEQYYKKDRHALICKHLMLFVVCRSRNLLYLILSYNVDE